VFFHLKCQSEVLFPFFRIRRRYLVVWHERAIHALKQQTARGHQAENLPRLHLSQLNLDCLTCICSLFFRRNYETKDEYKSTLEYLETPRWFGCESVHVLLVSNSEKSAIENYQAIYYANKLAGIVENIEL